MLSGMTAARRFPEEDEHLSRDHVVCLHGVSWDDYERILAIRGERSAPRISYLRGELEIMSRSRDHEGIKSTLGRLVEAWCFDRGVVFGAYGSWTVREKPLQLGAEPDECYVFGRDQKTERPHLALEVVWTSGGLDKLEIYRGLGVREVWTWKRGRISVHVLRGADYVPVAASEVLPGVDVDQLASFADLEPTSEAVVAYRAVLAAAR